MRGRVAAIALLFGPAVAAQPEAVAPPLTYALPVSARGVRALHRPTARPIPDATLHAAGSGLMTLAGQYVLTEKVGLGEGSALPVAAGVVLALGLVKEIADSQRVRSPEFSWPDLVANAFGVVLGAAIVGL